MRNEKKVLVLFAHPALQKSKVNKYLIQAPREMEGVTFHDLYETYPDYQINVPREQELLTQHDIIVFQHPFYWYSCPPLLKEWIDLVLTYGFAFGSEGLALKGKGMMQVVTTGGSEETYQHGGMNTFTMREFLTPFEQTARLCHMTYLAPYIVHGTHRHFEPRAVQPYADQYRMLLEGLCDGRIATEQLADAVLANDVLSALEKG